MNKIVNCPEEKADYSKKDEVETFEKETQFDYNTHQNFLSTDIQNFRIDSNVSTEFYQGQPVMKTPPGVSTVVMRNLGNKNDTF